MTVVMRHVVFDRANQVRHAPKGPAANALARDLGEPLLNLKDATQVKCLVLIVLALLMASAPTSAQPPGISKDQIREFLLAADVIAAEQTGTGTTRPWRLTLSDGTLTHDAHFQSVDRHEGPRRFGDRLERTFIDSYRYNIAAYGLAEVVGLGDMMPVTVERTWDGKRGSLSWRVDEVMFNEQTRLETRNWPADMERWSAQMARMLLFAELVQDTDRNQTNVLYTHDWTLYMIDFSRAFRTDHDLQRPNDLTSCDRALFARLQTLTRAEVEASTDPYLTGREVDAVLARRDTMVAHLMRLIEERGEDRVLYD